MTLNASKILVTGAGGFIGYNLCLALAGEGHQIVGVDLHYPENGLVSDGTYFDANVGDFRDAAKMKKWLAGVDHVVHLASAHLQISLDPAAYWDINVHSLKPLLKLVQKAGVKRFIHVSSVGVYGNLHELPADEETDCRPQSIYGETKLAGEKEVLAYSREHAFPVVIIRPAWVYGAYCPRTIKLYRTLKKGRFVIIGDGRNLRHPIYIADMIEAVKLCMSNDNAVGSIFLIAGDKALSTRELISDFCSAMELPYPKIRLPYWMGCLIASVAEKTFGAVGKEPPISKRSLEFFDTNNAFNITRARTVLGFEPRVSFADGLKDTRDWLVKNSND
jgi:nucleoside-diphosphate-sugar epimerase